MFLQWICCSRSTSIPVINAPLSPHETHHAHGRIAFRMSSPSPMAPPTLPLAFVSPVAWLVTAHFASLGLRGLPIDPSRLVKDPGPFGTKILWEMLKRVVFLFARCQAKNPRGGVLYPHVSIPRHCANSQYRVIARSVCQFFVTSSLLWNKLSNSKNDGLP